MRLIPEAEVIGPPDCPILLRYTVRPWEAGIRGKNKGARWKLMVHRFLPNADDRDVHDHPRPFWTVVLRGWYDDMAVCPGCNGSGRVVARLADLGWFDSSLGVRPIYEPCARCDGEGVVLRERMRPGMIRLRPANHIHRTKVGPNGCWTLVLMGPFRREWGFWHSGRWWFYKDYEAEFGYAMRCEDLSLEYRR